MALKDLMERLRKEAETPQERFARNQGVVQQGATGPPTPASPSVLAAGSAGIVPQTPVAAAPLRAGPQNQPSSTRLAMSMLWKGLTGQDTTDVGNRLMDPEQQARMAGLAQLFGPRSPFAAASAYAGAREQLDVYDDKKRQDEAYRRYGQGRIRDLMREGDFEQAEKWRGILADQPTPNLGRTSYRDTFRMVPISDTMQALHRLDPNTGEAFRIGEPVARFKAATSTGTGAQTRQEKASTGRAMRDAWRRNPPLASMVKFDTTLARQIYARLPYETDEQHQAWIREIEGKMGLSSEAAPEATPQVDPGLVKYFLDRYGGTRAP